MTNTHPVVVSSLDQARVLAAAGAATGCSVTLMGDGAVGGAAWFRALADAVRAELPGVAVTAVLECHDRPGLVLAGLRAGLGDLRFSGPPEVTARLAALVAAAGARLWREGGHNPSG